MGSLSNESKARIVLTHVGRPANDSQSLDASELSALAGIYDDCVAPGQRLSERFGAFWAARLERLEAAKATDSTSE